MRYEIKVTSQAQEQLREIRDYITQELLSPEAARNTILLLTSAMEALAEMPARVRLHGWRTMAYMGYSDESGWKFSDLLPN